MPGFDLAKLCHKIYKSNQNIEGLILLNHGIFTFGDSAKQSYDRMIKYVSAVEKYIETSKKNIKYIKNIKVKNSVNLSLLIRKHMVKLIKING